LFFGKLKIHEPPRFGPCGLAREPGLRQPGRPSRHYCPMLQFSGSWSI
jgi:hypothetical protein